jgi:uncharacterized protein
MRFPKRIVVISLFVLSLLFYAVQGAVWMRSTAHARSETDKQNMEQSHPPTYVPAIVASGLLVVAAALASIPLKPRP